MVKSELRSVRRERLGDGGVRWLRGGVEEVRVWLWYKTLVEGLMERALLQATAAA